MSFNFLMWFGIGLAFYLLVLLGIVLVKRYRNKKSFDKEVKEKEKEKDNEGETNGERKD